MLWATKALQTDCSEIILSKLDLDNTSERTCVAFIPYLPAVPCRWGAADLEFVFADCL
jgi:hypothetical protein